MEALVKKKREIFIEYKYLVGLCAYMRQADLSIDRCRWTSLKELRSFYDGKINEEYVLNFFIDLCRNLGLSPRYHELNNRSNGFNYVLSILYFGLLKRRGFLTINELETIYYLLESFKKLLLNKETDSKNIELLRLQLANYYTNILMPRLRKSDANRVLRIEHYLQNDSLQTLTLDEIVYKS